MHETFFTMSISADGDGRMRARHDLRLEVARRSSLANVRAGFNLVQLIVVLCVAGLLTGLFFLTPIRRAREPARRAQCLNNLQQIAIALQNYHDTFYSFPPPYTVDTDGNPLHSWRTLLLPFAGEAELYNSIDLSKPWDDPANAKASESSPHLYTCPSDCPKFHTTYLAMVGPHMAFLPNQGRNLSEFTDSQSKTIVIIEVPTDHAVPWMSPQDTGEQLILGLGSEAKVAHKGIIHAVMVDGSVKSIPLTLPVKTRRQLMTINQKDENSVEF